MQRKLSVRIIASLILSVMLFALPLGAALANSSTTVSVYAEESVSGNSTGTADDSATESNTSEGNGTDTDVPHPSEGSDSGAVDNSTWVTALLIMEQGHPIQHRLLNLRLNRSQNVSVTASVHSTITIMNVLCAVRIIRTAHIRIQA